jgi:peptide/nickel transport system permease protein
MAPGDAVDLLVPPTASAQDAARVRTALGLDASVATQYVRWLGALVSGDLGFSFVQNEPVTRVLGRAAPVSALLGGLSFLLTFVVGVPLGLWQAVHRGSARERVTSTVGITLYAAPSYWLALALIALFTYGATRLNLPWWLRLPAVGMESPGGEFTGWSRVFDIGRHAVLPVFVLAAIGAAGIARYVRGAANELTASDWLRTARAKGVRPRNIMLRHLAANTRSPIIVLAALTLPGVIAGSVFVESIFAWPGMGRVMLSAIAARDYPVVMGVTLLYAVLVIVANWIADVMLQLSDPRQRVT